MHLPLVGFVRSPALSVLLYRVNIGGIHVL